MPRILAIALLGLACAVSIPAEARVPDATMKRIKAQFLVKLGELKNRNHAVKMLVPCDHPTAVKLLLSLAGSGDSQAKKIASQRAKLEGKYDVLKDWYDKNWDRGNAVDHNVFNKKKKQLKDCRAALSDAMLAQGTGETLRWQAIDALGQTKDPEALALIYAAAVHKKDTWKKIGALLALSRCGKREEAATKIRPLIGGKDDRVTIAAIQACAMLGDAGAIPQIVDELALARPWQVRAAVCRWLPQYFAIAPRPKAELAKAVRKMIGQMSDIEGRLLEDYDICLNRLVDHSCGGDQTAWTQWLAANDDKLETIIDGGTLKDWEITDPAKGVHVFSEIPTRSKRILFVIDNQRWETFAGNARLGAFLDKLPKDALFGAVTYQQKAFRCPKSMIKQSARKSLLRWIMKSAVAKDRYADAYALWDGLNAMWEYDGAHKKSEKGPDTVYLITSGYANWGRKCGIDKKNDQEETKQAMLTEMKIRNQVRMLRINVIVAGKKGNFATARRLSLAGSGSFIEDYDD